MMIGHYAGQSPGAPELRQLGLRRAEALASAGRCADSARLLLELLEDCGTEERSRLQVRAAERLLQAGQVAAGLDAGRCAFETLDMSWPASPKAARRKQRWHQVLLRLRRVAPRRPEEVPDERTRARLQALAQLAHPMTWIDVARAGELSARYLRLALGAGDNAHALRALLCQTLMTTGPCGTVFEHARAFRDPQQDPELQAFWYFACGWKHWPDGSASAASADLERSEALYRSGAPRAAWALANVQAARSRMQFVTAPNRAWAADAEQRLAEATLRGDAFVSALISVSAFGALRHLMVDQPQRAVAEIQRVMGDWDSAQATSAQTANALNVTGLALLYAGGDAALQALRSVWDAYASADGLLPMLRGVRAEAALCAIASAADASSHRDELALARRELDKLPMEGAALHLAQVTWLQGDVDRARECARVAHATLPKDGMEIRAASVLLAFLQSSERGRAEAAGQQAWFAELGWLKPERAVATILPVYPLLCRS